MPGKYQRDIRHEKDRERESEKEATVGCRRTGSDIGWRDGSVREEERSICENEICAFDLRARVAAAPRWVDHGYGYEKVKLIQFDADPT